MFLACRDQTSQHVKCPSCTGGMGNGVHVGEKNSSLPSQTTSLDLKTSRHERKSKPARICAKICFVHSQNCSNPGFLDSKALFLGTRNNFPNSDIKTQNPTTLFNHGRGLTLIKAMSYPRSNSCMTLGLAKFLNFAPSQAVFTKEFLLSKFAQT